MRKRIMVCVARARSVPERRMMSALIEMATNSRPSSAAEPPPMMTAKSVHHSKLLPLSSPFASCTQHLLWATSADDEFR